MGHNNHNHVSLIGRLARDPELTYTQSQKALCKFAIAVGKKYKDSQGRTIEDVSFFEITAWGNLANIISQYQHKGDLIFIEGRLSQDKWVDKDTQKNRSKVTITATGCEFLGSKSNGGAPSNSPPPTTQQAGQNTASVPPPDTPPDDVDFDAESLGSDEVPF